MISTIHQSIGPVSTSYRPVLPLSLSSQSSSPSCQCVQLVSPTSQSQQCPVLPASPVSRSSSSSNHSISWSCQCVQPARPVAMVLPVSPASQFLQPVLPISSLGRSLSRSYGRSGIQRPSFVMTSVVVSIRNCAKILSLRSIVRHVGSVHQGGSDVPGRAGVRARESTVAENVETVCASTAKNANRVNANHRTCMSSVWV